MAQLIDAQGGRMTFKRSHSKFIERPPAGCPEGLWYMSHYSWERKGNCFYHPRAGLWKMRKAFMVWGRGLTEPEVSRGDWGETEQLTHAQSPVCTCLNCGTFSCPYNFGCGFFLNPLQWALRMLTEGSRRLSKTRRGVKHRKALTEGAGNRWDRRCLHTEISPQPCQLPKCKGGKNPAPVHLGFNPDSTF